MDAKLFDTFLDGVAIMKSNRTLVYVNPAFAEICGVSIRACLGQELLVVFPFDPEIGEAPWKKLELIKSPTLYTSGSLKSLGNDSRELQVSIQPVPSRQGSPYYLLTVRDHTLEKRLHRKYKVEAQRNETLATKLNSRLIEAVLYSNLPESQSESLSSDEILSRILMNAVNIFGLKALAVLDVKSKDGFPELGVYAARVGFTKEALRTQVNEFWQKHRTERGQAPGSTQVYEVELQSGTKLSCWPIEQNSQINSVMVVFRENNSRRQFDNDDILLGRIAAQIQRHISPSELDERSVVDIPTQLHNRRYLLSRLNVELEIARRADSPLCLVQFDIDGLRFLNEKFGRQAGDAIIQSVALTAKNAARESDIIARFEGGQFTAVLLETVPSGAIVIAERIRSRVEELIVDPDRPDMKATVSLGIAAFPGQAQDRDDLLGRANQALGKAKLLGRNNIQLYFPEDDTKVGDDETLILTRGKAS